jgi:hypothetical protein
MHKIEGGKLYLTKGGYIVEIVTVGSWFFATQRTSPDTRDGKDVVSYAKANYYPPALYVNGWQYNDSGRIFHDRGFEKAVYNDLEIVAEYPYKLVDPPSGYKWKGGFPKVSTLQKGDYYLAYETMTDTRQHASECFIGSDFTKRDAIGSKRIVLEKVTSENKQEVATKSPEIVGDKYYLPKSTCLYLNHRKYYVKKQNGKWYGCSTSPEEWEDTTPEKFWATEIAQRNLIACSKEEALARVAPEKQEVWPKYYINKDISRNWGVVRYDKKQCHFYRVVESGRDNGGPFDWCHDDVAERGVWKEVTKEEMVARFDKDPLSSKKEEIPQQYYIPTAGPFNFAIYWMRKSDGSWYYTNEYRKDATDLSPDTTFQKGIHEKKLIPCSKEEALAHFEKVTKKKEVATPPIVAPQLTKSTVSLPVSSSKEVKMNTFTSIVKSVSNSALRAAKHVYVEPAMIVGGHIKRSLRYVVFFGTIAGAIYGANNPEKLKKNVMAYMPKITIEAPEIMK